MSFLQQGVGSAIAATAAPEDEARRNMGINILITGLVAQLGTFSLCLIVLTLFCRRVQAGSESCRNKGGNYSLAGVSPKRDFGFNPLVKQVMKGVWIASASVQVGLSTPSSSVMLIVIDSISIPNR